MNQHIVIISVALAVCGLLAGCTSYPGGTGYRDDWVPPSGERGKLCVRACEAASWRCERRLADRVEVCGINAMDAYDDCLEQADFQLSNCYDRLVLIHGEEWEQFAGTCTDTAQSCGIPKCDVPHNCSRTYEQCFNECGGTIVESIYESQPLQTRK